MITNREHLWPWSHKRVGRATKAERSAPLVEGLYGQWPWTPLALIVLNKPPCYFCSQPVTHTVQCFPHIGNRVALRHTIAQCHTIEWGHYTLPPGLWETLQSVFCFLLVHLLVDLVAIKLPQYICMCVQKCVYVCMSVSVCFSVNKCQCIRYNKPDILDSINSKTNSV